MVQKRDAAQVGLMLAYWGLATVQLLAFLKGVEVWLGWSWWAGLILWAAAMMFGPFGAIALVVLVYIGAHTGWEWAWWQAVLLAAPTLILGGILIMARMSGDALSSRPRI